MKTALFVSLALVTTMLGACTSEQKSSSLKDYPTVLTSFKNDDERCTVRIDLDTHYNDELLFSALPKNPLAPFDRVLLAEPVEGFKSIRENEFIEIHNKIDDVEHIEARLNFAYGELNNYTVRRVDTATGEVVGEVLECVDMVIGK